MRLVTATLTFLLLATPLASQEGPPAIPIEPGDVIRLRSPFPGQTIVPARVTSVGDVYFGYAIENDPENRIFTGELLTLDTLDVRERSRRYSARTGAVWGGYLGAALGLIGGPFAAPGMDIETGTSVALFGAAGTAMGALSGATIGALIAPARWYRYVRRR